MRTPNKPSDADLATYIAGMSSTVRRAEIEQWIATDRANAEHVDALRTVLLTGLPSDSWNRARMWGNIEAEIERTDTPAPAEPTAPAATTRFGSVFRARQSLLAAMSIAAAIIVVATGATYLLRSLSPRADVPPREYATRRGERVTVQLSDGSRVTLAPDSRLRVAGAFGAERRSVELEGEAQFDVVHDSTRPFSVHAAHALVVDIGTRFDLRAYPTDRDARVAVSEGAVTLGVFPAADAAERTARAEGVLVRRGEIGRLDSSGNARTSSIENAAVYFAWADDQLVFVRAPLREVLQTISHWVDADVRVTDPALGDRVVTAELSTKSPTEIARALAQAVNAAVVDSGRTIMLVPR